MDTVGLGDNAGLVWEEPPPPSERSLVGVRVAILKEHPGKWARYPGKTAPKLLRAHGLEAIQRSVKGQTITYVRWPPDEQHVVDEPTAAAVAAVERRFPTVAPAKPRPKLSVLLCRQPDCGFETLRDQRRKMENHVTDNHGRPASTVELTPIVR